MSYPYPVDDAYMAVRLLIELAIDLAAAPAADPAKRCRAYLDEHYPATTAST